MELPKLPSELIRVALKDLIKCEKSLKYRINMSDWYITDGDVCSVCLAGAVMAKSLSDNGFKARGPSNYPKPIRKQLLFLDAIRNGEVFEALESLKPSYSRKWHLAYGSDSENVSKYHDDPFWFKHNLRAVVRKLKKIGL